MYRSECLLVGRDVVACPALSHAYRYGVGFFSEHVSLTNTFQVVVVGTTDGRSYAVIIADQLTWDAGTFSQA